MSVHVHTQPHTPLHCSEPMLLRKPSHRNAKAHSPLSTLKWQNCEKVQDD